MQITKKEVKSTEDVFNEAMMIDRESTNLHMIYQSAVGERDREISSLNKRLGRLEHLVTILLSINPLNENQIGFLQKDKTGLKEEFKEILT